MAQVLATVATWLAPGLCARDAEPIGPILGGDVPFVIVMWALVVFRSTAWLLMVGLAMVGQAFAEIVGRVMGQLLYLATSMRCG